MSDEQTLSPEIEPEPIEDEEISDAELEANQPPADPDIEGTEGLPE